MHSELFHFIISSINVGIRVDATFGQKKMRTRNGKLSKKKIFLFLSLLTGQLTIESPCPGAKNAR